eukprot:6484384-Amphidinium_carterae.1
MAEGFDLVGVAEFSHLFPYAFKTGGGTVDGLNTTRKWKNPMLLASTSESSNAEVEKMVWQQCLDETTKGW